MLVDEHLKIYDPYSICIMYWLPYFWYSSCWCWPTLISWTATLGPTTGRSPGGWSKAHTHPSTFTQHVLDTSWETRNFRSFYLECQIWLANWHHCTLRGFAENRTGYLPWPPDPTTPNRYPFNWRKVTSRSWAGIPTNHRTASSRYIQTCII